MEDDSGTQFHDWEVLHDDQFYSSLSTSSDLIDSGSLIRFDYFSLPNHQTYVNTSVDSSVSNPEEESEKLSLESNDCFTNTIELRSDSGDDRLDEDEFNKSHAKTDYDGTDITKSVFNSEEITSEAENLERRESDDGELSCCDVFAGDDLVSIKDMENKRDSEEFGESESSQDEFLDKFCADSSGNESVTADYMDSVNNSNEEFGGEDGGLNEEVNVEIKEEAKSGDVEAKRRLVWWKIPFEVLKYCFLRASPAWSFSVAAAFMGVVILGRRLYNMKRKTTNFQLKIAVDNKRVSQFASRAARMNEAFSMVRRVPVVRASLTAPGVNSWPAMSMR